MKQKMKTSKRFFFSLLLAGVTLSALLVTMEFIFPSPVTAKNLINHSKVSSDQDTPATIASPPIAFVQASSAITLYLPLIFKNPVLVYSDDFLDSDSDWAETDDGDCVSVYESGRYKLTIDRDKTCIPRPAPGGSAQRLYGEFETAVYHSGENESDGVSNAVFGIFTNGQGGGNYYIFKIRPNISNCSGGGGWEFIRRVNSTETTLIRVDCTNLITRGFGSDKTNVLRLKHNTNHVITLYINGVQVYAINEGPVASGGTGKELTGSATGLYAESASDQVSIIKFDYFKVYSVP